MCLFLSKVPPTAGTKVPWYHRLSYSVWTPFGDVNSHFYYFFLSKYALQFKNDMITLNWVERLWVILKPFGGP